MQKLIPNILLMVIILIMGLSTFLTCDMIYAMLIIVTLSLAEIFSVVFARLHVATLQKIVRKTYAAEIILGLLLLIVAFAYVLTFTDSETIPTFIDGIWYCFAIVTTIGFGDFTVTTLVGRVLSMVLGVYGIIVVALITSIIVNFYGEMKKEPEHSGEQLIEKTFWRKKTAKRVSSVEEMGLDLRGSGPFFSGSCFPLPVKTSAQCSTRPEDDMLRNRLSPAESILP